jgi:hypothetical protein
MGGLSTIDVTRQGIDKGYGLRQIEEHLHVPISEMLFIGDAIFPGGNDFAATTTGVEYIKTSGPQETEEIIRQIVAAWICARPAFPPRFIWPGPCCAPKV